MRMVAATRPLPRSLLVLIALVGLMATPALADSRRDGFKTPLVIGHRGGATGYLPDHTLENYAVGIELGADFVEPDLVMTRDGHLIARHEPNIKTTTDVASHPEFAARRRTALVDGVEDEGWFASDFTLAEIKTLRAIQPLPERPQQFNGRFQIPTLEEIIAFVKRKSKEKDRTIGIYPEIKHSTYHKSIGLPIEGPLVRILRAAGWDHRNAPVFIQSFEQSNLRELRRMTRIRLIQLIDANDVNPDGSLDYTPPFDRPFDWTASGDPQLLARTFGFLVTDAGLREVATYADGIGPWKRYIVSSEAADLDQEGTVGDENGDGNVDEADRGVAAADQPRPACSRPGTSRAHVDVPQRAEAARLRLRRQSRERIPAVLRAGRGWRLRRLRGHRRRRAHPVRAVPRSRLRALSRRRRPLRLAVPLSS